MPEAKGLSTADAFAFFKEEVEADEQIVRLAAIKKAKIIAGAMGPR